MSTKSVITMIYLGCMCIVAQTTRSDKRSSFKLRCGCKQVNRYKGSSRNEKLPLRRIPAVGIVRKVSSKINTTPPTNIITMGCRLPLLWCGFNGLPQSDAWVAIRRGWPRALTRLGLIKIDKIIV